MNARRKSQLLLASVYLALIGGCTQQGIRPYRVAYLLRLRDTTGSAHEAPTIRDADNEMVEQDHETMKSLRGTAVIECYTSSVAGKGAPPLRLTERLDSAQTARRRKRQSEQAESRLKGWFEQIEREPSVTGKTQLMKEIYYLCQRSGELRNATRAYREVAVISDLEEFTPRYLTAAEIMTTSDRKRKGLLQRTLSDFPPLSVPPHKLVVIYVLSKEGFESFKPEQIERLITFWKDVFHGWGIQEVEITAPGGAAVADKETASSPFSSQASREEMPTLEMANNAGGTDVLTLHSVGGRQSYTLELPYHETKALTLAPGLYAIDLRAQGGSSADWTGRGRFRAFKKYEAHYVNGEGGIPLTIGDPE